MMNEKRTRKMSTKKPKEVSSLIQQCHDIACCDIERDNKKPSMNLPKPKHMTRWSSGFCKLCGEHMDCITHLHAEKHGYKRAEDLIAAGAIVFD